MDTLFDYEIEAANIIVKNKFTLLFDGMGVGKTVTTLESLKKASEGSTGPFKCIVCVPNTIVWQWASEVSKWLQWDCVVYQGNRDQRFIKYKYFTSIDHSVIMIVTYNFLQNDVCFKYCNLDALVLDEGYLFRNANTKLYQFLKDFIGNAKRSIVLSGNYESLTADQFRNIVKLFFDVSNVDKSKESLCEFLGTSFISRNLIELNCSVQTEPVFEMVKQELTEQQIQMLSTLAIQENQAMKNSDSYSARKFYQKRMEVLLSPRIHDIRQEKSPKEKFLLELLQRTDEKIVVYCPNLKLFKLLKSDLNEQGVNFAFVSGGMSIDLKNRNLNLFDLDENCRCLLVSNVAKFGLNLQCAHTLLCMGIPKDFELKQMLGRMIRVNQKEPVVCLIPYVNGIVEGQKVRDLQLDFS